MTVKFGFLDFGSFVVNIAFGRIDSSAPPQTFLVHERSEAKNRIVSGNVAKFTAGKYGQSYGTLQTSKKMQTQDLDQAFERHSRIQFELEDKRGVVHQLKTELKELEEEFEETSLELTKLTSQKAPVDLISRSVIHFDDELDPISWVTGLSKKKIASIVVQHLDSPIPASILMAIRAIADFVSGDWDDSSPENALSNFLKKPTKRVAKSSRVYSEASVTSFESTIQAAIDRQEKDLSLVRSELAELTNQRDHVSSELATLKNSISELKSEKHALEEILSETLRESLAKVGIFPNPSSSARKFAETLVKFAFRHPFEGGEFDALSTLLGSKVSPLLLKALISTQLNVFADDIRTCCFHKVEACLCDPAESSSKEVANRFNLGWRDFTSMMLERGRFCWSLKLLESLQQIKHVHAFYPRAEMPHLLESMIAPDWATSERVLRNRSLSRASLSEIELRDLNSLLVQQHSYSRSEAVEHLRLRHPGFKGKTPSEVMAEISYMVWEFGPNETAQQLADARDIIFPS